jgi:hypothetical protein
MVVGSAVVDRELLLVVCVCVCVVRVASVVGVGGGAAAAAEFEVVRVGGAVGWEVLGRLPTGVSGIRVPATVERAADVDATRESADPSLGTVTGGRVALGRTAVRDASEGLAAELGDVADRPATLPQAASSNTVIPCPAAIRAVRRLRWEDTPPS